jgi:hypothetical protein
MIICLVYKCSRKVDDGDECSSISHAVGVVM